MEYRKLTAGKIFDGYRMHSGSTLIVSSDGKIIDLIPSEKAGEGVEQFDGILSPGLVNCHCHLELSHMRDLIPEGTGLVDFVFKVVTTRNLAEEEIYQAIEKADREMAANGIVAVGDICNNAMTLAQKKKSNISYYNFIEASGWLPAVSDTRFSATLKLLRLFEELSGSGRYTSIVPHAPYSVSGALWQLIQPYFEGKVVSIHNQETAAEDEFFMHGTGDFLRMYQLMNLDNSHHTPTGKTSLQTYFSKLGKADRRLLVHNTYTGEKDLAYLNSLENGISENTFFCLCINANLYIEGKLPPVELLRAYCCPIVLGTDSLASNWSLSIIDEIRSLRKHFPELPLHEMLRWATINGARALDLDRRLGSFEKGKRPGVLVLDPDLISVRSLLPA